MEVYVLLGDNGYDGREVLGVYDSVSAMADAARAYQGDFASEGFLFETRQLNTTAEEGFLAGFTERLELGNVKEYLAHSMTGLAHQ
jgi:hypothetical protein